MKKRMQGIVASSALLALTLAACSADGGSEQPSAPEISADVADVIDGLPDELRSQYEGAVSAVSMSPFADFEAVDGPWEICYSDSYQGNAWRVAVSDELERLAAEQQEAGLVSGFQVTVAENDVARQSQQVRQFVDKGCSGIIMISGSSTGLNSSIEYAADKGVPVVTIAGSVTSEQAINVDSNYAVLGEDLARAAADASDSVMMVKGIEGDPIAVQQNDGAQAVWDEQDTNIVAEVNGDWTPSITKEAVISAIATNASDIGAVWSTGSETAVIAQTFEETGRDIPLITGSVSGDAIGYWKKNSDFRFDGVGLLPSWTAQTGFNIMLRTLDGKGPQLSTLMVPVPAISDADFDSMWRECMTPDAVSVFPVAVDDPLPADLMGAYFADADQVGNFDYASTPDPCE